MEIQLNNQRRIITAPLSVQQLLDEVVGEKQKGIAVAINNTVVPKSTWAQQLIQTNDNIIIIKATQGG
jgi:sulfur carrier protein